MCGRFSLTTPEELIAEVFALDERPKLSARYNIAPSQEVPVIVQPEGRRKLEMHRWGMLAPGEAERDDALLINARAETVATKPLFREAFRARRCLIPADGFYEWRKAGSRREPFHIRLRDRRPFAFAGLWREEKDAQAQRPLRTCVIVTTEPNAVMGGIHDRMPAILAPEAYAAWLDASQAAPASLQPLLRPSPAGEMEAVRVSTYVNGAAAEGPRCLEPERQASLFD
jgi:putative SOS response-associated peptidase YedK